MTCGCTKVSTAGSDRRGLVGLRSLSARASRPDITSGFEHELMAPVLDIKTASEIWRKVQQQPPPLTCPQGHVLTHPEDIARHYCGTCREFLSTADGPWRPYHTYLVNAVIITPQLNGWSDLEGESQIQLYPGPKRDGQRVVMTYSSINNIL